ncbi:unnamed protein product [Ambrosiozyma monospora]|uniref:Unnamed protein product n=1 Tax=Ambrosiozyma monospora TaxID=43982 RepID=A0ACB5U146_AMBMO|nr:unnamed protein product [Ambrosiozyma monospora]
MKSSAYDLIITPLRLARKNSLSKKILKGLSKTTFDSVLMLSEISQSKIKQYFASTSPPKQQSFNQRCGSQGASDILGSSPTDDGFADDEDVLKPHNWREIIVKLYNTLNVNSNYVVLVDLSVGEETTSIYGIIPISRMN